MSEKGFRWNFDEVSHDFSLDSDRVIADALDRMLVIERNFEERVTLALMIDALRGKGYVVTKEEGEE